jgi:hypothetical protein
MAKRRLEPDLAALERVGRALYGDLWVERPGKREYKLGKSREELPAGLKKAATAAKARHRVAAYEAQSQLVIHWLQERHDLDMSRRGFDPAKFEAFFAKAIGAPVITSPTDRRLAAIRTTIKNGKTPGRGGNITWKVFHRLVDPSKSVDQKTIERDVRKLRGK